MVKASAIVVMHSGSLDTRLRGIMCSKLKIKCIKTIQLEIPEVRLLMEKQWKQLQVSQFPPAICFPFPSISLLPMKQYFQWKDL
jgi:hypothetical protein